MGERVKCMHTHRLLINLMVSLAQEMRCMIMSSPSVMCRIIRTHH